MAKSKPIRHYGWKKDIFDQRDHILQLNQLRQIDYPPVDLRPACPPIRDQGQMGSCVGNSVCSITEYDLLSQKIPLKLLSRLFVYYNARRLEGSTKSDAGATIRDGIKTLAKDGVCAESLWPYLQSNLFKAPNPPAYKSALKTRAVSYARVVQTYDGINSCLAAGYPFVFGFTVYESFESAKVTRTGMVSMPGPRERILGGHAVYCCGRVQKSPGAFYYVCANSWGLRFGDKGYFYLPESFMLSPLVSDLWVVRTVSI